MKVRVFTCQRIRKDLMEYSNEFICKLDQFFPILVFVYGALLLGILNMKATSQLGEKIVPPEMWKKFKSHSPLAWISFFVGGFWVLENIWFS